MRMTREELRESITALEITQGELATKVSRLTGLYVLPSHISKMCSRSKTGRDPSPAVAAVVRLMLENREAVRLYNALIELGWSPDNGGS